MLSYVELRTRGVGLDTAASGRLGRRLEGVAARPVTLGSALVALLTRWLIVTLGVKQQPSWQR